MFLSILWYLGGALVAMGGLCVMRPIKWLRLPTRKRAALTALAGFLLAVTTLFFGTGTHRVEKPVTLLDGVFPVFQFDERHTIEIAASAERVYKALLEVTPEEISGYRTLTWIRCLGQCAGESIMNPASRTPIIETALKTSFRKLAERPNEELVFGGFVAAPAGAAARAWTLETYLALAEPGFAKVAMNFRLVPRTAGITRLETETRVYATDSSTRRVFTAYWRTILPGSALIRRQWLRAIRSRAENREP